MREQPEPKTLIAQVAAHARRAGMTPDEAAAELTKEIISQSLHEHRGNQCRVARELKMHRNTLNRKLRELKIAHLPRECRFEALNQLPLGLRKQITQRARAILQQVA